VRCFQVFRAVAPYPKNQEGIADAPAIPRGTDADQEGIMETIVWVALLWLIPAATLGWILWR
jgi:hypothetical protein